METFLRVAPCRLSLQLAATVPCTLLLPLSIRLLVCLANATILENPAYYITLFFTFLVQALPFASPICHLRPRDVGSGVTTRTSHTPNVRGNTERTLCHQLCSALLVNDHTAIFTQGPVLTTAIS